MNSWALIYEGLEPEKERLREALCTLGNGYFATRGAAAETDADEIHYPGTYLACGYNRAETVIAGRVVENEDLVNLPNWLPVKFRIEEGEWFDPLKVRLLEYRQELDLRRGVLMRTVQFRDSEGRQTRMVNRRFVFMASPHLAALETILTAENWSGRLEVRSALDGRVINAGVERYRGLTSQHLEPLTTEAVDEDSVLLKVQTNQSEIRIAQAARTQVFREGRPLQVPRHTIEAPGYVAQEFSVDIRKGEEIRIEKVVALFTSRDDAISECGRRARTVLARAGRFDELLRRHTLAWEHLWRRFDMEIEFERSQDGNRRMAMVLHLHIFHLLQTISTHTMDMDVGVPSRGWHGEAYRGHIFWDELFIFPLLNLRLPQITRALLLYRYRRLDEARAAAARAGYRGAMYPWQSGSTGREESQKVHLNPKSGRWMPDNSRLQRHVSSAIAYNVWRYYQVTCDTEFLSSCGAEMILEIARFWASIATYNPEFDRYEILGIMGPDEYHDAYPGAEQPGLSNNAYANIMAAWVLCRALDVLAILPEERRSELCEILSLGEEELRQWDRISRRMRVVFHGNGIISQFEGYDQLEEFDWEKYERKYGSIQRLDRILEAEGDTPNRYKASKQADVLMLFYLFSSEELGRLFQRLGYPFEYETIPRNIDYYVRRTSHGSTLSRVVHSWVLARSDRVRSWQLFVEALESDVADIQNGTTPEGVHLGAMAGTLDFIQRGSTGIYTQGDVLWLNPCLPGELTKLRMQIRYRTHSLNVEIARDNFKVSALRSLEAPIRIGFRDEICEIKAGETREFTLAQACCSNK